MAKSVQYWRDRAEATSRRIRESEAKALEQITRAYERTTREIVDRINSIYNAYGYRYSLSPIEARAALAAPVSQEEYLAMWARLEEMDPLSSEYMALAKEASTRAYAFRIRREAYLLENTRIDLAYLAQTQYNATTEYLKEAFGISADSLQEQLSSRLGVAVGRPGVDVMDRILNEAWSGMNYSERIWKSADALQTTLQEVMTGGLITGRSQEDMAQEIAQRMGVGLSNARRLVRTESTYVNNQVALESYRQAGLEEYEYLTAKDERVCVVCGPLDGRRFRLADAVIGENLPPMHPNCRCTTIAVVNEKAAEKAAQARAARQFDDYLSESGRSVLDDYEYKLANKRDIIKTDTVRKLPIQGIPDSIADLISEDGSVDQRRFYDSAGYAALDVDTTDHGYPAKHPEGAHAHDWVVDALLADRKKQRNLSLYELKVLIDLIRKRR